MKKLILLIFVVAASLNAQAVQGQIGQVPVVAAADNSPVGGAGNLTTVGSVPYVSASGILNQDAGQFFWDATNNRLGIGTTAPGDLLHIKGNAARYAVQDNNSGPASYFGVDANGDALLQLYDSASNEDIRLYAVLNGNNWINNGGNFGIGTIIPTNKLTVVGSGAAIRITGTSDASAAYFQFNTSGSSGLGYVGVEGITGGATLANTLAYATFLAAGSTSSALQLGTPGGIRATILASGNVGIGTTAPDFRLHVAGSTDLDTAILISTPGASPGSGAGLEFKYAGGGAGTNRIARIMSAVQSGGGGDLLFQTAPGATNPYATQMTLLRNGNVGIGTTGPGYKLEVLGSSNTEIARVGDGTRSFGISTYTPNSGGVTLRNSGTGLISLTAANAVLIGTSYAGLGSGIAANTVAIEGNVGIGTTTPGSLLHIKGAVATGLKVESTGGYSIIDFLNTGGESLIVPSADTMTFYTGAIGTTTAKVNIGGPSVGYTFRAYDQTASTGSTLGVFRAGVAQSGNVLEVQNNAGANVLSVSATGQLTSAVSITAGGNVTAGVTQDLGWSTRSTMTSPSSGVIALYNNAQTDFNRLQFGGTTSSFPSIQRSTTKLFFRLADDSAGATVRAGGYESSDGSSGVTGATCSAWKNGICTAL